MTSEPWHSVILAAGLGTRMKSARPKVVHAIAGRPLVAHVAAAAVAAGADRVAVVIGPDMDEVRAALAPLARHARYFTQSERLGTAHAALAARPALAEAGGDVIILYGDTPLLRPETLIRLRARLGEGAAVAILGFETANPHGYGRLLLDGTGGVTAIREEKDASDTERAITLCNSGVMAFRGGLVLTLLERIGNANAKGEFYLTDAVEIARGLGHRVAVEICPENEVMGVNDRVQLARAEALMQARLREAAMLAGATLTAPETVTFSYDTQLGRDVVVEPNVFFGRAVTVADNAVIKANSYMEEVRICEGASIGPFARLRPGADIGEGARIGNFVEIKKAVVEAGAKIGHLSYIGDARVGARANIGAGTIVCNYDGFRKTVTDIGEGAFVGSNTALVSPVKIGDGAYIGTGSVITRDVEPGALAIERSEQKQISGWVERKKAKQQK
jgi:bifunctional UDP-N-acetylglucosamine pyrophosphorylase/glucosamine-1-phosphate N-acetyltransferase